MRNVIQIAVMHTMHTVARNEIWYAYTRPTHSRCLLTQYKFHYYYLPREIEDLRLAIVIFVFVILVVNVGI
jgi:hypothetical protein